MREYEILHGELLQRLDHIINLLIKNKHQAEEIERLRAALTGIKIWAEGSACEICGKKKMTDTDAYDYAVKALKQEEVKG